MPRPSDSPAADVRSRIDAGMNVRPGPLAKFAGLSLTSLRHAIERGDIKVVRIGRNILIPHHEAAKLLGIQSQEAA